MYAHWATPPRLPVHIAAAPEMRQDAHWKRKSSFAGADKATASVPSSPAAVGGRGSDLAALEACWVVSGGDGRSVVGKTLRAVAASARTRDSDVASNSDFESQAASGRERMWNASICSFATGAGRRCWVVVVGRVFVRCTHRMDVKRTVVPGSARDVVGIDTAFALA